jgi:integrase
VACVRKHHGHWVAEFRDPSGKRRRERPKGAFSNKALEKRAAEELLARRKQELSMHTYDFESTTRTFADLWKQYRANKAWGRPGSEKDMSGPVENYLLPYFGWMPLRSIRPDRVEAYLKALTVRPLPDCIVEALKNRREEKPMKRTSRARKAVLAPGHATINRTLRNLRTLLTYAEKQAWVDRNAASLVEQLPARSRDVVLSVEELKRVLASAEGPPRDANGVLTAASPNWALIIKVGAFTGMRHGEILGLQWHDLHASENSLYVVRTSKGSYTNDPKTERGKRWVEVPPALMSELRTWQTELRNIGVSVEGHDPIFPTRNGKAHSISNSLNRGWYPALKRAGVYDKKTGAGKYVKFHDLRRTAVSLMSDSGISEGDISATLGHSIATMRAVYSHPMPKKRRGGTDTIASILTDGTETVPKGPSPLREIKSAG